MSFDTSIKHSSTQGTLPVQQTWVQLSVNHETRTGFVLLIQQVSTASVWSGEHEQREECDVYSALWHRRASYTNQWGAELLKWWWWCGGVAGHVPRGPRPSRICDGAPVVTLAGFMGAPLSILTRGPVCNALVTKSISGGSTCSLPSTYCSVSSTICVLLWYVSANTLLIFSPSKYLFVTFEVSSTLIGLIW